MGLRRGSCFCFSRGLAWLFGDRLQTLLVCAGEFFSFDVRNLAEGERKAPRCLLIFGRLLVRRFGS